MVRSGSLSVDSSASHRRTPSRTVTLGHIQPQAPSYRTVYCNDRDSNMPVRFKVLHWIDYWIRTLEFVFSYFIVLNFYSFFLSSLCLQSICVFLVILTNVLLQGNSISTTKYNVFTFLPKGLFEQVNIHAFSLLLGSKKGC